MDEWLLTPACTVWGFLCGLYVSYAIIKGVRKRHFAQLRRAMRRKIDVDTQIINRRQLITRVTLNGHKALLIYVSSDSELQYQTYGPEGPSKGEERRVCTTLQ